MGTDSRWKTRILQDKRASMCFLAASFSPPMAHPESYTAFGFVAKDGPLERLTMPWSDPKAGHVVVKVLACGICAG